MPTINTYLNFNGKAEEAFNFYKSIFGGEFSAIQYMRDTPEGDKLPINEQNRIMHISLPIGGNVLMASDCLDSAGHQLKKGNNCYVSVQTDSPEEAEKLFSGLSEGGEIEMPLEKMFWGALFGSFVDKFGICWMIDCELK